MPHCPPDGRAELASTDVAGSSDGKAKEIWPEPPVPGALGELALICIGLTRGLAFLACLGAVGLAFAEVFGGGYHILRDGPGCSVPNLMLDVVLAAVCLAVFSAFGVVVRMGRGGK